jgi:hypothetical protein
VMYAPGELETIIQRGSNLVDQQVAAENSTRKAQYLGGQDASGNTFSTSAMKVFLENLAAGLVKKEDRPNAKNAVAKDTSGTQAVMVETTTPVCPPFDIPAMATSGGGIKIGPQTSSKNYWAAVYGDGNEEGKQVFFQGPNIVVERRHAFGGGGGWWTTLLTRPVEVPPFEMEQATAA